MSEDVEHGTAAEALVKYPKGIFIYAPVSDDHESIKDRLTKFLPGRMVIVTPKVPICPQDMGVRREKRLFLGPHGIEFIQKVLPEAFKAPWGEIKASLPDITSDENLSYVGGGREIEVAGSGKVYTLNNSSLFKIFTGTDIYDYLEADTNVVPCSSIAYAIRELHRLNPKNDNLYYGHLDLLLTGCCVDGIEKLYMDETLYNYAKDNGLLDFCLSHATPVNHDLVIKGGLNITYVDHTALVPSRDVVPAELLIELEKAGYNVVEMGEQEYILDKGAGVKCRSLSLDWK